MATIITRIDQSKVISNLDTYNHTTLAAGMYTVSIQVSEIPPSGVTLSIKQNSSTIASVSVPAAAQQLTQLRVVINCAISDVLGVVIASSTAREAGPNQIKGILNIHQGSV